MKTLAPTAVILAALAYLALAEPGQPGASSVAVTPTDATTANQSPVTAGAQDAPPMGPAVAVNREMLVADYVAELERRFGKCEGDHPGEVCPRYKIYYLEAEAAADRFLAGKPASLADAEWQKHAATIIGNDTRKPALAEPVVVEGIYWRTDFNAAQLEASQRKKPLVRLVTNVATCAPCRALEAGPLSDQATIQWLNRNVVMTQRLPRKDESIPFFEVQVRPNVWRPVRIATMSTRTFLNWFREVVR